MDMQYLLDYGQYFSENDGKNERISQREDRTLCREAEQYYTYKEGSDNALSSLQSVDPLTPEFWKFPNARGSVQPWRRRLWEQRNKF
ncbi:hypothetical protein PaeBR_20390 [Paenibacillus sp. BR2-3]|uniref:hypothetical protein n=1 Tax=Paenibacillus sp. BR2-3 TaxID=3048494 RepID=UPI00397747A8